MGEGSIAIEFFTVRIGFTMDITFLGATGTVTGSKYLVESGNRRVLVDCGLFQGVKQLRLRNRTPLPFDASTLDAVILTHAHLDHSGYLPVLVRSGYGGPVYCTEATRDLCGILLPDSGHLQEEEAEFANRHGFSRHHPALPLYTRADAVRALEQLQPLPYDHDQALPGGMRFRFLRAGHILGSAMIHLRNSDTDILFSGDLGRLEDPVMPPPDTVHRATHLVVESTYGDRLHPDVDPADRLAEIVTRTARRGGAVVIPAFAVGRTQSLLHLMHRLREERRIPDIPVYLDSPMATEATEIFQSHPDEHRLSADEARAACGVARVVTSVEESKHIDRMRVPRVIISASGMATGGRVVHHLKALVPDPKNTILFVGHQAAGTRGSAMLGGAASIKIHGGYIPIRAELAVLHNVSAHADYAEIMQWLGRFQGAPLTTWITHGEPVAADALRHRIEEQLGWKVIVPDYLERVTLASRPPSEQPEPAATALVGA